MKFLRVLFLLLLPAMAFADAPGAKPRPAGSVAVVNVSAFPQWRFYFMAGHDNDLNTGTMLTDSAVQLTAGGRGAPVQYSLVARRLSDSLRTKPLYYSCYDGHLLLRIDSIRLSDTSIVVSTLPQILPAMQEIKDGQKSSRGWIVWLSVAVVAVSGFVAFWVVRKKKAAKANEQRTVGDTKS
ncbi:MAG: hypothetical protein MUC87_05740 [Bacteroidia bacterium]|jgi:hypothetical protein|nr:hypothetical protein [Bacteroidia bacterium]